MKNSVNMFFLIKKTRYLIYNFIIRHSFNFRCDREKKDSDDSHDTNEKGPDIIPLSKDSEGKTLYFKHVKPEDKMALFSFALLFFF